MTSEPSLKKPKQNEGDTYKTLKTLTKNETQEADTYITKLFSIKDSFLKSETKVIPNFPVHPLAPITRHPTNKNIPLILGRKEKFKLPELTKHEQFYLLEGPMGIGKSFALLEYFVSIFFRDDCRCIYIPDMGSITKDARNFYTFLYIAFHKDLDIEYAGKTIRYHLLDAYEYTRSGYTDLALGIIIILNAYCISKNFKLYLIYDQVNHIFLNQQISSNVPPVKSPGEINSSLAYRMTLLLSGKKWPITILGASANNLINAQDIYRNAKRLFRPTDSFYFDKDECQLWLGTMKNGLLNKYDLEEVKKYTSNVPLQLCYLYGILEMPTPTPGFGFASSLDDYFAKMVNVVVIRHKHFLRTKIYEQVEETKKRLLEEFNMALLSMVTPESTRTYGEVDLFLDKYHMWYNDMVKKVVPLFPAALQGLMKNYPDLNKDLALYNVNKSIIRFANTEKGFALEGMIIYQFSTLSSPIDLLYSTWHTTNSMVITRSSDSINIPAQLKTQTFTTYADAKNSILHHLDDNYLLIPPKCMPDIDLLIYLGATSAKRILAIQVTLSTASVYKPPNDPNPFWSKTNSNGSGVRKDGHAQTIYNNFKIWPEFVWICSGVSSATPNEFPKHPNMKIDGVVRECKEYFISFLSSVQQAKFLGWDTSKKDDYLPSLCDLTTTSFKDLAEFNINKT